MSDLGGLYTAGFNDGKAQQDADLDALKWRVAEQDAALAAKDARIAELEGALLAAAYHMEAGCLMEKNPEQCAGAAAARIAARAVLAPKEA